MSSSFSHFDRQGQRYPSLSAAATVTSPAPISPCCESILREYSIPSLDCHGQRGQRDEKEVAEVRCVGKVVRSGSNVVSYITATRSNVYLAVVAVVVGCSHCSCYYFAQTYLSVSSPFKYTLYGLLLFFLYSHAHDIFI